MDEIPTTANLVPEPPIQALEMVRRIRDAFYERTRGLSAGELRALIAREAEEAEAEPEDAVPGRSSAA